MFGIWQNCWPDILSSMGNQPEPSSNTEIVVVFLVVILTLAVFGFAAYRWLKNPTPLGGPYQTYKPNR
jgi:polyferredoxin